MGKKVCNVKVCNLPKSDISILRFLYDNRAGMSVKNLIKLTGFKQRHLYKRLNILKQKGLTEHIFPVWKISNGQAEKCAMLLKDNNIFELHNFSVVLKLIKTPDWWNKRKSKLIKLKEWNFKNICFGKGESNPYQQLINENWVIQTYPESIIIIARKRYYSNSPYETSTQAINDIIDIINYLEERLKFKLFPNEIPAVEIRNNDFNRIKDSLAEHCKKEGRRFLVETNKGKVWVDYSEPFGKEANTPDIQDTLERHTKDLIEKKPMLPSEIQELVIENIKCVTGMLQVQQMNAENIITHQKVLKEMSISLNNINVTMKLLQKTIKDKK